MSFALTTDQIMVSIHAPRFREAMPLTGCPTVHVTCGFQSTPPVSGRRCPQGAQVADRHHHVSIHAPRFREAMHEHQRPRPGA